MQYNPNKQQAKINRNRLYVHDTAFIPPLSPLQLLTEIHELKKISKLQ